MKLSIIIPTYNRCRKLKLALESLSNLVIDSALECEVIVVDNNSMDSTKQVMAGCVFSERATFRYVFEGRQGKSHALNTGIKQANGDVLVFTDDDCIPDSYWIMAIAKEFANDPSISIVGGRVELFDKGDKLVTVVRFGDRACICSPRELFFPPRIMGCNMAISRNVFDIIGDFDPLLGPGTRMGLVCEDTDFLYRAFRKRFKMIYEPGAVVFHNHGRKSDTEVDAVTRNYFKGRGAFYCKHMLRGDPDILKMAFYEVYGLVKTVIKGLILRKEFPLQRILLESLFLGGYHYLFARSMGGK